MLLIKYEIYKFVLFNRMSFSDFCIQIEGLNEMVNSMSHYIDVYADRWWIYSYLKIYGYLNLFRSLNAPSSLLGGGDSKVAESTTPPLFVTKPLPLVTVTENQSVNLECRLTPIGDPTMKVEWYKDGIILKQGLFVWYSLWKSEMYWKYLG